MTPAGVDALLAALAEPFGEGEVKFRAGATSGNRALALAYIDSRVVMDRLDAVLGPINWQDHYEFLPDGSVLCKLSLRLAGEWVVKMDVGGESEQKDEGDRRKAAVSDALKRTAVKWGIGRYLYRLPQQWVDYDPQKKQLKSLPKLPAPQKTAQQPAPKQANGAAKPQPPDHRAYIARLEKWLVGLDVCAPDALFAAVAEKVSDGGSLDRLTEEGSRQATKQAEWSAREMFAGACSDRMAEIGVKELAAALDIAHIAAGATFATMSWHQLEKLLKVLREQPAAVAV
jgi:hypothetical protein